MQNQEFKEVLIVDLASVVPYHNNPRNNEGAVDGLAKVIQTNGFLVPLVVDKDMVLITGHTRRLAMMKLGMTKAQIIVADHLSPEQVQAFRLADNRVSENSKWDEGKLAEELRQLSEIGFDLESTGFSKEELDCLCGSIDASCLDEMDYASVCGTVNPKAVQARDNVVVSVGNYRLYVHINDYKQWEAEMLSKHPKRNELIGALITMLGFPNTALAAAELIEQAEDKGADETAQAAEVAE